jgi:hypothetical protein
MTGTWTVTSSAVPIHMIQYLDFTEGALATSAGAAEFQRRMVRRYPDYGCLKVLDHQLRFLFR